MIQLAIDTTNKIVVTCMHFYKILQTSSRTFDEKSLKPGFFGVFFETSFVKFAEDSLNTFSGLLEDGKPTEIRLEILLGVDCFPGRL